MSENFTFPKLPGTCKGSLQVGGFLGLALMVSACSVNKLEDVMGPGPNAQQAATPIAAKSPPATAPPLSLAAPPADLSIPQSAKAVSEAESLISAEPTLGTRVLPEEGAPSPLLAAEEDQTKFSPTSPWRAILNIDGIDATNAEGTTCSGRYGSDKQQVSVGLKVFLACSDGGTGVLQILSLQPNAMRGSLKIGNSQFGVALEKLKQPTG